MLVLESNSNICVGLLNLKLFTTYANFMDNLKCLSAYAFFLINFFYMSLSSDYVKGLIFTYYTHTTIWLATFSLFLNNWCGFVFFCLLA